MRRVVRRCTPLLLVAAAHTTGCLPYSMGATAATVRPQEIETTTSMTKIVSAGSLRRPDGVSTSSADLEMRTGLNDRSDIGVRVTTLSGLVMSYKHRLAGSNTTGGLAVQSEGGFVNFGAHGLLGVSVVGSSNEVRDVGVFGGARVLAVAPMTTGAVSDRPSTGGFLGLRLGAGPVSFYPEVGVFHDPSALHLRRSSWIVVPTLAIRRSRSNRWQRADGRRVPWDRPVDGVHPAPVVRPGGRSPRPG